MEENPWSKMLEIMRKQSKDYEGIVIGEVLSAPPSLVIKVGDLQVDKDNILIADYLLKDYLREYKSSSDNSSWGSTNYIRYEDTLKAGERLAIATTLDKQTYIVLARLVRL